MITAIVTTTRLACLAWVVAASLPAAAAWAGEPNLTIRSEGIEIIVEIGSASRSEAIEELLAPSNAAVEWAERALGEETIRGRYSGSQGEVVRELLGPANFIIAYEAGKEGPRITRVVVFGPAGQGGNAAQASSVPKGSVRKAQAPIAEPEAPRQPAWARRLEKMKADAEAVRKRTAALGNRRGPVRTQAVRRTLPAGGAGHTGAIPVVPAPKKRRQHP
jgi:hypothetical protein